MLFPFHFALGKTYSYCNPYIFYNICHWKKKSQGINSQVLFQKKIKKKIKLLISHKFANNILNIHEDKRQGLMSC